MRALVVLLVICSAAESQIRKANHTEQPGGLKGAKDILALFGYPCEEHVVRTDDGYFLQIDRIANPGRPPVYVANPVISSATIYLHQGPGFSLGFMLYEAGFDVWLGNVRGSPFSDHEFLSPEGREFWKFSFHEHGMFDHPASIDHILLKTGRSQLLYVGFSMGSTTFLVMASMRPEYNQKVQAAFLMAPVASFYYSTSNLKRLLAAIHNATEMIFDRRALYEFPHGIVRNWNQRHCRGPKRGTCNSVYAFLLNSAVVEDVGGNCYYFGESFPSSGSWPTFWHYAQNADAPDRFRLYNYSPKKNMLLYGSPVPPSYPLHRITVPSYLYTGDSDVLTVPKDLDFLKRSVRSVVKHYRHPDPLFSHADFSWSRRSRVINQELIGDMYSSMSSFK